MSFKENPTAQKLMKSFIQFNKADWRQRPIAGYKHSEIMVLICLNKGAKPETAGMKVSEISNLLHVTSPTITQLVNGLEVSGLVVRNIAQVDKRTVCIQLTEKGRDVAQQAMNIFTASFSGLVEHLGEEQSDQLAELLFKVFIYFNERANLHQSQLKGDDEA